MKNKVYYSRKGNGTIFRPYLDVNFLHINGQQGGSQRCLIDTGADSFLLPYTLGKYMGLTYKTAELLSGPTAEGVGGAINTLKRTVKLVVEHKHSGKNHTKEVEVSWLVPTEEEEAKKEKLKQTFKAIERQYNEYPEKRKQDLLKEVERKKKEYQEFAAKFEQEPLIGREFMKNFTYLTFIHEEDDFQSYFEYQFRP